MSSPVSTALRGHNVAAISAPQKESHLYRILAHSKEGTPERSQESYSA
jgi:hypothetical protein